MRQASSIAISRRPISWSPPAGEDSRLRPREAVQRRGGPGPVRLGHRARHLSCDVARAGPRTAARSEIRPVLARVTGVRTGDRRLAVPRADRGRNHGADLSPRSAADLRGRPVAAARARRSRPSPVAEVARRAAAAHRGRGDRALEAIERASALDRTRQHPLANPALTSVPTEVDAKRQTPARPSGSPRTSSERRQVTVVCSEIAGLSGALAAAALDRCPAAALRRRA